MTVFTLTLIVGNLLSPPDKAIHAYSLGHDFTAFYTGGTFARLHQFDRLYDVEAVKAFEQQIGRDNGLGLRDAYGPWWNPPFYAWVFAPLSALPYFAALQTWLLINLLCAVFAFIAMTRMLPAGSNWKRWGLIPVLVFVSCPFQQALGHAQNTCTSLLILALVVLAWRARRAVVAGMLAGLLFYKPQLGAVIALAIIATLGWRSLLGLASTGATLLAINLLTMPGSLELYLHRLPEILRFMQVDHMYLWERHVTLKAFWRLLLQGRGPGEATLAVRALWLMSEAALGLGLLHAWTRWRTQRLDAGALDRLIAATIAAMPLLMPFYFDYDLLLLTVAAVLWSADFIRRGQPTLDKADRWLMGTWAALFLWLNVNPVVGGKTDINLAVPLLCLVSAQLIARCVRLSRADQLAPGNQLPAPWETLRDAA